MPRASNPRELLELNFIHRVSDILRSALNSLPTFTPGSDEEFYLGTIAHQIGAASSGYLCLRAAGHEYAAKLLVRSMLETTFYMRAVVKSPLNCFNIQYAEILEELALFDTPDQQEALKKELAEVVARCQSRFPTHIFPSKLRINVRDMAEAADMPKQYKEYRLYCKYQHGAQTAVRGGFDILTDEIDNTFVIGALLNTLLILKNATPATVPDVQPLFSEWDNIRPPGQE